MRAVEACWRSFTSYTTLLILEARVGDALVGLSCSV